MTLNQQYAFLKPIASKNGFTNLITNEVCCTCEFKEQIIDKLIMSFIFIEQRKITLWVPLVYSIEFFCTKAVFMFSIIVNMLVKCI